MGRFIILANVHVCVLLNFCKLPWTQMNSEFWRCGLLRTIKYTYKCGTYLPYKILQAVLQFQLHSIILSFLYRFYFSIAMLLFAFCSRYSYLHIGIINNRWGIPYTLVHLSTPYYHLLLSRIVNRTRYFQVILCNDQALAILMSMYIRTWEDSLKF